MAVACWFVVGCVLAVGFAAMCWRFTGVWFSGVWLPLVVCIVPLFPRWLF